MARIETWLICNLGTPVEVKYLDGHMFTMDNQGNLIGVEVYNTDGTPATLSGTISGNVVRADGKTVAIANGTVIDGYKAYIILPQAAYAKVGPIRITMKLTSGSVITTLCAIITHVFQSTTSTIVDPGTVIPSIETLIQDIDDARASIPQDYSSMWQTFASAFSASHSGGYSVGEYTTYNGGLYRFVNNHSGNWNASDVVRVTVGEELSSISALMPEVATTTETQAIIDEYEAVPL